MAAVLIIGKPNSGKSLLFNRLTGLRQKVANFPGVTVEVKSGSDGEIEYTDYPGIYSFNPLTRDEEIAVDKFRIALAETNISAVLCTLDGTRLERSLVLGLQVQQEARKRNKPVLFALNMIDELSANNTSVDASSLEKILGSPVAAISEKRELGLTELKSSLRKMILDPERAMAPAAILSLDHSQILSKAREINRLLVPNAAINL